MLPRKHPVRIRVSFDGHRLVANATLAPRLGLPQLVRKRLDLGDAAGRANTGGKLMTLVASALAGGDCIDDADALRTGGNPTSKGARGRTLRSRDQLSRRILILELNQSQGEMRR